VSSPQDSAAAQLSAAADRLVHRVGHWSKARWAEPARGTGAGTSRGDAVFALVERLAGLAATIEGRAAHAVPRLASDMVLPDQLRVMVLDLLAVAPPDALLSAAHDLDATGSSL